VLEADDLKAKAMILVYNSHSGSHAVIEPVEMRSLSLSKCGLRTGLDCLQPEQGTFA